MMGCTSGPTRGNCVVYFNIPALTIHYELMRGSSFPCETFRNDVLAHDYNFKIIEMEFWGLSEECEVLLRGLRQKTSLLSLK